MHPQYIELNNECHPHLYKGQNTLHNFSKFRVGVSQMCNINTAQCSIMFTRNGDESHLILDYNFKSIFRNAVAWNNYKKLT